MSDSWSFLCLDPGTSVLVASVDAKGLATCCRGVAVKSDDGFRTVTVYVPVATSRDVIANVAVTRRMAVSVTQPLDHQSVQLKGTTTSVRLAAEPEKQFVEQRLMKFADTLAEVGLPKRITRSIAHWPAFAIDLAVEQVFEQTPGPKAGQQLT